MLVLLLFVLGLVVGSFIASLTWRLPRDKSVVKGRSSCPNCGKVISWYDNIPLFSFLNLGGRCRSCTSKISLRYPIIELSTSIVFVATGLALGNCATIFRGTTFQGICQWAEWLGPFTLPFFLFIFSALIAIFVIDFEHQVIPDSPLFLVFLAVFLALLSVPSPTLFENLAAGVLGALFFAFLNFVTLGRGMGEGDAGLVLLLGLLLGPVATVTFLFLSFVGGAVVGVFLLLSGRATLGKPIPFGPYLILSATVVLFFGNFLNFWYR